MKKTLLFTLLASGIGLSAMAQETVDAAAVQKIREEGLNHSQVMKTAFYLTDVAGPRLSGSPGLKKAQNWALGQLKSYGLMNSKLEPWGKFGKGWQVNKNYAAITVPYYHAIIAIPKAWTGSTKGTIKGEVMLLKVDTVTDLPKYKGQLAGKIVIVDNNAPALVRSTTPDLSRYTDAELAKMAAATASPAGGRRNAGNPQMAAFMANRARAAAKRTAISKFLQDENVSLILSQGRGTDGTVFTTNGASYADTAKMALPELETSGEDYLRIVRLLRAGQKVQMEADVQTQFFTDDLKGYNVVAELPGTDKKLKDQVVMIGGHFDSWHAATGATDNAAGSAVMMEAMRILKAIGFKPKRTIRIALWSSEEQGLFGSRGYVAAHFGKPDSAAKAERAKVSAYYNLDNGTGKIRGVYLQGNAAVGPIFQSWLEPFKDLGATTVTISNTGGTDHQSFDAVSIPGFQFIQDGMDYNTRTHQ